MAIFELAYPLKLLILKAMHIIQGYEIINLNYEYEKLEIRKIYTEPEEAFAFLHSLKPCRENAFLFRNH